MISKTYKLSLALNENVFEFFSEAVGKNSADFREAVTSRARVSFSHLKGVIQSMTVSDTRLDVTWQRTSEKIGPIESIVDLLKKGNYADAALLLELFLGADPDNADILFNLGMLYSDQDKLPRAVALLSRLVELEPAHINGRVALGVALLRNQRDEDGIRELETVVAREPGNLWARRNLGAGLMRLERFSEALEQLRAATEIDPNDPIAWFGYGQALEATRQTQEADGAYIKAIQLDTGGNIAEQARQARTKMAEASFRSANPGFPRMDAVMYCLDAITKFAGMTDEQVRKIGYEIAMLGTRGIDVNSSAKQYNLRSLPGSYSGLHLVCMEYVAFQKVAPGQDIGFDLGNEYQMARGMFKE